MDQRNLYLYIKPIPISSRGVYAIESAEKI